MNAYRAAPIAAPLSPGLGGTIISFVKFKFANVLIEAELSATPPENKNEFVFVSLYAWSNILERMKFVISCAPLAISANL